MVLQAIKTDFNVSVKLSLSLFNNQICSILLYGSAVWSLPNHQNLIYPTNQNEDQRSREIASEFTTLWGEMYQSYMHGEWARLRMPRTDVYLFGWNIIMVASPMSLWPLWWPPTGSSMFMVVVMLLICSVLHCLYSVGNKITTTTTNDVLELIQSPSNGDIVEFQHFYDTKDSAIEMVHKNFLKKSLNINKHASYTCIYKEFKRCPVTHRAWAMAIKCWIRLNSGAENCLLNEAYEMPQVEND